MKILFISNGHGEDIISARIIKELLSLKENTSVSALPLVGAGDAFNNLPIEILGTRLSLPSGGFIYQSFLNIFKDISAGLLSNTYKQIKLIKSMRGKFDLAVAIGDIVPILGALILKKPFVFIGCAKSDFYNYSYTPWEKYLLKKYCSLCFPRDKKTAGNLAKDGIKIKFAGNPMMDCFNITGDNFNITPDTKVIGILPGSHDDAFINMEDISKILAEINLAAYKEDMKIAFLTAAAPNIDSSKFPNLPNNRIIKDKFGDVLNRSDIIIGMSGTGNEQAAGLGKPVISMPGRGVQYTNAFAKKQKQLLGDSLIVSCPGKMAKEVLYLLSNPGLQNKMSGEGKERMGGPGACREIAKIIKNETWI